MRISEALAIERRKFTNDGCTIQVRQQVHREKPLIVSYLKTDAAYRDIDLHPEVAESRLTDIQPRKYLSKSGTPAAHNSCPHYFRVARDPSGIGPFQTSQNRTFGQDNFWIACRWP
jgi:hypothetical protein